MVCDVNVFKNRIQVDAAISGTTTTKTSFFKKRMNATATNVGGWVATELRAWLNDTFFNAFPADLQAVISLCTKYTDNVGNKSTAAESVTATSDNIWLMKAYEFGKTNGQNPYEISKQKTYGTYPAPGGSWLRSPENTGATRFITLMSLQYATALAYVMPCFTIA